MRKAISIPIILLVAFLFICSIVYAQPGRVEKIKAEIFMHKQAIERLRAELIAMGVPPPQEAAAVTTSSSQAGTTTSGAVTTEAGPATTVIVPPPLRGNPPGPAGGPGTSWDNPPGPRGGPGASPNRPGGRR